MPEGKDEEGMSIAVFRYRSSPPHCRVGSKACILCLGLVSRNLHGLPQFAIKSRGVSGLDCCKVKFLTSIPHSSTGGGAVII